MKLQYFRLQLTEFAPRTTEKSTSDVCERPCVMLGQNIQCDCMHALDISISSLGGVSMYWHAVRGSVEMYRASLVCELMAIIRNYDRHGMINDLLKQDFCNGMC